MKKLFVSFLVVMLCISTTASAADKIVIGLTLPSLASSFFADLLENVMDEAENLDIEVITLDAANDDIQLQVPHVESLISQGVDGILVVLTDTKAPVYGVKSAHEAGIPVVTIFEKVEGADVYVGTDYEAVGEAAAKYLDYQLKKQGKERKVVVLEGRPDNTASSGMKSGFDKAASNLGIEILAHETADWDRAKARAIMEDLLWHHPDIQGVFAASNQMILGASEALKSTGKLERVITIGYGATPVDIESLKDGELTAIIEDYPIYQARQGLQFLVDLLNGKEIPQENLFFPVILFDETSCPECGCPGCIPVRGGGSPTPTPTP